ncbi:MAG TPA: 3,4-dihydroxy-2-butanone-4-phosphate synthase [Candidatus Limnocylindria bacterium]
MSAEATAPPKRAFPSGVAVASVEVALNELRAGRSVIVVDEGAPGDVGDLVRAAQFCGANTVAFMQEHASGSICVPMSAERAATLDLPPLHPSPQLPYGDTFTVSADAKEGITNGVSAADLARTLRVLADPHTRRADLVVPGHLFAARARAGGVLVRAGHVEAAVDLCRLAGLEPVAALSTIASADGTRAPLASFEELARTHQLPIVAVKDLIAYRMAREHLVEAISHSHLPTRFGTFEVSGYRVHSLEGDVQHVAVTLGDVTDGEPVLVRVQTACFAADVLGSLACDCRSSREGALRRIAQEGRGVLLYLRTTQDAVGTCQLQLRRSEIEEAERRDGLRGTQREYGIGAQILKDLGIRKLRLLTNSTHQLVSLYDLEVVEHVPLDSIDLPAAATASNSMTGERYRELAGSFPTGVTIVTTRDPADGSVKGLTSQTFVGLSTEPPLIMISLARTSRTVPALLRARSFVVNFLAEGNEEISDLFASKADEKFHGVSWVPSDIAGGAPILRDQSVAYAECTVVEVHEGGDHWIFVGRVDGGDLRGGTPLLYYRRKYAPWPEA